MRYTLRHGYEEPHRMTGEYLDGDCKGVAGEWLMEETASGETRVTFKVGIDPGAWVPEHSHESSTSRSCASRSSDSRQRWRQRIQGSRTGSDPPW